MSPKETGEKLIASNKKARHEYHILDTYEAGLVLTGSEVKSLRMGRASLVDGYVFIERGEAWLDAAYIPEYLNGSWTNTRRAASASCCCTASRSTSSTRRPARAA